MKMKSIFYLLLSVLLFSCQGRVIEDHNWHELLTLKTPEATTNPVGVYTVEYTFDYDTNNLELRAEPSSDFTKTTLRLGLSNPDSIHFFVKTLDNAKEDDYSVVLTDVISKYNGQLLPKDIVLDRRTLQKGDSWNINYTKNLYNPEFEYSIPMAVWKRWLIYGGGSLLLLLLLFLLLKRDNMPFGKQTFENGRLSFNNPQLNMVKLADKQEFDLGKYLTGSVDLDLKIKHKKLKHKKKQIKVARLSFSDPSIRIKIIHFDGEEVASSGCQLFDKDDLIISLKIDNENKNFNITYFNIKNKR